jgi:hypothetical protein
MNESRRNLPWLLLVLVGLVGAGGAVLGVALSPKTATLTGAVRNTNLAPNYTVVVTERTPQGNQTDNLVWEAPNRLGGYIQSGSRRTYVYVLPSGTGSAEYQSLTVSATAQPRHLVFYRQASQSAALLNPATNYLRYAHEATHVSQTGSTYSFTLTQTSTEGKETGQFAYTVSGQYISAFTLTVGTSSVHMTISDVGSSPPVRLPAGSKVVASSASGG